MNPEQHGESVPYEEFDPHVFAQAYQEVLSRGDIDKIERLQAIIYEGVFEKPDFAVELYMVLALSDMKEVRESAVIGIARAFKCDPEAIAPIWKALLNDSDMEIAELAYLTFEELCDNMDRDLEDHRDLSGIAEPLLL